jgi:hypothetical protein
VSTPAPNLAQEEIMRTCLSIRRGVGLAVTAFGITAACAGPESPAAGTAPPTPTASVDADNPNSAAGDEKRIIHGWFNGEEVDLRYTRLYFCAEPPESDVETGCVVGAPATIAPRSGPIPRIYALSPAGFIPSPETVHCPGGTVCPNHPPTLDTHLVPGLPPSVRAPAHSHIITDRQAGWHNTVNIRVLSPIAWEEIAQAKTLAKVRELQAAGLVGPDLPTNVYFFFEMQNPDREQ